MVDIWLIEITVITNACIHQSFQHWNTHQQVKQWMATAVGSTVIRCHNQTKEMCFKRRLHCFSSSKLRIISNPCWFSVPEVNEDRIAVISCQEIHTKFELNFCWFQFQTFNPIYYGLYENLFTMGGPYGPRARKCLEVICWRWNLEGLLKGTQGLQKIQIIDIDIIDIIQQTVLKG